LFRLVLESHDGRALGADSEEKHEPVSDIDTAAADSLKVLDPKRPIREADISGIALATPLPPNSGSTCKVGGADGGTRTRMDIFPTQEF